MKFFAILSLIIEARRDRDIRLYWHLLARLTGNKKKSSAMCRWTGWFKRGLGRLRLDHFGGDVEFGELIDMLLDRAQLG